MSVVWGSGEVGDPAQCSGQEGDRMIAARLKRVLREAVRTEKRLLLLGVVLSVCVGTWIWWNNYYPLTDEYTGRLFFIEESSCERYVSSVVMDENLGVERLDVRRLVASPSPSDGNGFLVHVAVHTDENDAHMESQYGLSPYEITAGIRSGLVLTSVLAALVLFGVVLLCIEDKVRQRKIG